MIFYKGLCVWDIVFFLESIGNVYWVLNFVLKISKYLFFSEKTQ